MTSPLALRFDAGTLGKMERTPTGGVRIPARVTREGVLMYARADGSVQREYRPADEVFKADSLATLADAAVTIGHPASGKVTPETFRQDSVGYVRDRGRQDGRFVAADIAVQDGAAIKRVDDRDLIELSCGYSCRLDMTAGTTPSGERYDAVQRDITYNHVALLPRGGGRAGRDVALRIDGASAELGETTKDEPAPERRVERTDTMKTQRIDGIDYEIGTPAWTQACERRDAKIAADAVALEKRAKDAEIERDKATARADAADKRVKELEAELAPEKLDARVTARTALVGSARAVLGAAEKLDGKSELEIMRAVLAKSCPELKLDGKSDDYIRARFEAETERAVKATPSALDTARADAFPVPPVGQPVTATYDPSAFSPNLADKWRQR